MINRKLKAAIIQKFGNQYSFADRAGLHESQISRFIRGRKPQPSRAMKEKIATLLDVGVDVFEMDSKGAE